ncbi:MULTISPECIES: metal ABC transporter solute-binding protein, Zn/Mn family [Oscillatoriales]|uniref:ABC transporter substrate=binding protein n=1 Tax=Limnospira platensis NIES-46 TaxID=1236695 RepID=A0A5M3T6I5_LIMPL|nr:MULTISPECIES: zinc ABC transporter substrate-binding protein [Arthrospira]AMW28458.1 manganese ABC transporter substrate-binding protein [Arthrospira platensis YZ]KDR56399.1 manganese ABC transporter substrate-binding protein [Arthrospira platensis str. Paraca]MBD2670561.1 zinc ABC transporter substrate-binding protein [Arthrospira platensis FACHB-439]MDF2209660.1 zinc ABC transporter substrate-binding protein [Arthrospira platensis NCB002]MDT9183630.1 zinc ABC transporter substrate-binding
MARPMAKGLGVVGLLCGLLLGGCQSPSVVSTGDEMPKVVSTTTIIADLTEAIASEQIQHTSLLQPGVDPHIYEPVPQDSIALENADLILYNGYNLEPGLIRLIEAVGQRARRVAVAEFITPLNTEENGEIEPDPHVWGNVQNAIVMAEVIRDELIALSPDDRQIFTDNAEQLIEELEKLHIWIGEQIATIPSDRRYLVTTHDAFQYYAAAYGLTVPGTLIGISTEEQPSAQTVRNLAEEIRRHRVPAIFAETTLNPQLIRAVAEEAGVELAPQELYSDSIGAPGSQGDSYVRMMEANTRAIVEALGDN